MSKWSTAAGWSSPHHNFAPEYQCSGQPFVTASANDEVTDAADAGHSIKFPFVTRWLIITCTDSSNGLKIGFTQNGVDTKGASVSGSYDERTPANHANYFTLAASATTHRLELKCTEVFFRGNGGASDFSLIAGLTGVPPSQFYTMTGSAGFQGVG